MHPIPTASTLRQALRPLQWLTALLACVLVCVVGVAIAPDPAWATVQITLEQLSYKPCPPSETGDSMVLFGGVMSANCFTIEGVAVNPTNKTVYDADVFGRIYDANGNDAIPERGRLGSIAVVPPGESAFEIVVSVPADQPEPLQFKQFKATGFSGKVR